MNPKISTFIMTENHDFDMSHPALSRTTVQPGPGSAVHYKNSVYLQFTAFGGIRGLLSVPWLSCAAVIVSRPSDNLAWSHATKDSSHYRQLN